MTTLIERAAKALAKEVGMEANWPLYERKAIAVLRAIREPTDKMINAGRSKLMQRIKQNGQMDIWQCDLAAEEIWRGMIDAELKETEE